MLLIRSMDTRNTSKLIIVFAIMGLASGLLLGIDTAWPEAFRWLIPGAIFGTILYVTLRRYQFITINHRISLFVLILATTIGLSLAGQVLNLADTSSYGSPPTSVSISMAGLSGAFCVAISLLWVCEINIRRSLFVSIVSVFGLVGAVIYVSIDPLYNKLQFLYPIWHSIVFIGIAVGLLLVREGQDQE